MATLHQKKERNQSDGNKRGTAKRLGLPSITD
jgi:hypothetical protein